MSRFFIPSACWMHSHHWLHTGHAFDAASWLCKQVLENFPCGGILVSDAVMQAVCRTHVLEFSGAGYVLAGRHECQTDPILYSSAQLWMSICVTSTQSFFAYQMVDTFPIPTWHDREDKAPLWNYFWGYFGQRCVGKRAALTRWGHWTRFWP